MPDENGTVDASGGRRRGHSSMWLLIALALAVATLGAYTRLTNTSGVFRDDVVFYGGLDSYYHARRVQATLRDFPHVPSFDAWGNVGQGGMQLDWPKGFDLGVASLCRLVQVFTDDPDAVEATMALAPAGVGVAVCLVLLGLGWWLGGPWAGLGAGIVGAVLPILTGYSMIGRLDHHAAEPLLVLAPLLLLFGAVGAEGSRRPRAWAAGAGVALAAGIAIWPGAIAVGGIIWMALLAALALDWKTSASWEELGLWTFGAALVTMIPIALWHPWAWQGSFDYWAPAWLQPVCFGAAAAGMGAAWLARRRKAGRSLRVATAVLATVLVTGLLAATIPALGEAAVTALEYLSRREVQISQVHESYPLFREGVGKALEQYTWLALLAPLWALLVLRRIRRIREADPTQATRLGLVGLVSLGTAALAIAQMRLGSLFAPLWAILVGLGTCEAVDWLAARRLRPRLADGLAGLAFVGLLAPTAPLHQPMTVSGTPEFVRSYDVMAWLRLHGASAGNALALDSVPAFAVMAPWQWGHWLAWVSGHANIANPLGQTPQNQAGVRDSVRYFLSEDPHEADQLAERLKVRYVLAVPLLGDLPELLRHLDRPAEQYLETGENGQMEVHPPAFGLLNHRLQLFDGRAMVLGSRRFDPIRTLRLVVESSAPTELLGRRIAYAKLFERVRGARLVGRAPAGTRVELRLSLQTHTGRVVEYRDFAQADEQGEARFRLPYSTDPGAGVRAMGPVRIRVSGRTTPLEVPEVAVLWGQEIRWSGQ